MRSQSNQKAILNPRIRLIFSLWYLNSICKGSFLFPLATSKNLQESPRIWENQVSKFKVEDAMKIKDSVQRSKRRFWSTLCHTAMAIAAVSRVIQTKEEKEAAHGHNKRPKEKQRIQHVSHIILSTTAALSDPIKYHLRRIWHNKQIRRQYIEFSANSLCYSYRR